MLKQHWVFTEKELKHPKACYGTDIFLARPYGHKISVQVQRDGTVTNRYGDGTVGVLEAHKELAVAEEGLCTSDGCTLADTWRDVHCDDNGNFLEFIEQEYYLSWSIELSACDPEDAARRALAMMRDPHSTATVFRVTKPDGTKTVVDLSKK